MVRKWRIQKEIPTQKPEEGKIDIQVQVLILRKYFPIGGHSVTRT